MRTSSADFCPSEKLAHAAVFIMALVVITGITQFLDKPFDDANASEIHFTVENTPYNFKVGQAN